MANEVKRIKKIKLSNGQVYGIFDEGAIHVDETTGKLVSGNPVVDTVILDNDSITIAEIDDETIDSQFLVYNSETGRIEYRDKTKVLADIGGITCGYDSTDGTLTFKVGI